MIMYTARCTTAYTVVDKLQYTVIYTVVYIVKYIVVCTVEYTVMCTIRYAFAEVNRPDASTARAAPRHGSVMNHRRVVYVERPQAEDVEEGLPASPLLRPLQQRLDCFNSS
jgi:hypothetical protein